MKILQVIPSLEVGGAETMCEGLSKLLKAQGQDVTVVSLYRLETPITRRLQEAGVALRYLDKKPGLDPGCVLRLRRLLKREKPDVIHVHLFALKYVGAAAVGLSIPLVHTIHNVASYDAEHDKAVNKYLYTTGKAVPVSLSREIQKTVVEFYGLPESATPVIFNGIDLESCIPKSDYTLSSPAGIIHVGRFWEQKNHECMVRALKLLKDRGCPVVLDCFGEGSLLEPTRALARELGVEDSIRFRGLTDRVFPHLNRADLFILPSKWEGMPMTIIEAMGTGLPVIASDVGGVADMITTGRNGLLIRPDPRELADAIARLLEDDALRAQLGRNALADSIRFSGAAMARSYLELYRSRL